MPYFTDSKGRDWNVRVTPYAMREVKDFAGINLGTILQDNMQPLGKLLQDPADLCAVIYAICKEQADSRNIDLKDFMEGIVGEPIEAATGALLEGLQECFPTQQKALLTATITVLKYEKMKQQKRVDKLLTDLTYLSSRSRWQRLLAWIRGIIRGVNLHSYSRPTIQHRSNMT